MLFRSMRLALIVGLAGALVGLPSLTAAHRDPDAAGVAEAIRFERAKQAAADRQARIEARGGETKTLQHAARAARTKTKTVDTASAPSKPSQPRNPR